MKAATRLSGIELSLIRQINALATPGSINLGIGEPNLVPDETLLEMAREASAEPWRYSANPGLPALRELLCDGTPFDPATEVCVTAGTQEALFAIFTAFVDPGDEVLVPDPGFVVYATLAKLCGATAVPYELTPPDWRVDLDALRSQVNSRTKAIIVNSPSNPLGAVMDVATLDAIAALGPLVIADEVYRELWYEQPPPSMLGRGANVLTVSGMSKSHGMTGLRLGWIHGGRELMKPIVTAHQYIATCASVFAQELAIRILRRAEWNAGWLARVREQLARQRAVALEVIERELEVALTPPPAAFYAFAPVPLCGTLEFAKSLAQEAGVLVIPGVAFGARGEGFIRISWAASAQQIVTGVERIGRWLRGAGR
jgi:aspartate/methionine/tyrosine aminotransferase